MARVKRLFDRKTIWCFTLALTILFSTIIPTANQVLAINDAAGGSGDGKGINFNVLSADITPADQANSSSYYKILTGCFRKDLSSNNIKKPSDPASWFNSKNVVYLDGKKIDKGCSSIMAKALNLWGVTDNGLFLQMVGCKYNKSGGYYGCDKDNTKRANNFKTGVKNLVYNSADVNTTPAGNYYRDVQIFNNKCAPSLVGSMDDLNTASMGTNTTARNEANTKLDKINKNYYSTKTEGGSQTNMSVTATIYNSLNMYSNDDKKVVNYGYKYQSSVGSLITGVGEGWYWDESGTKYEKVLASKSTVNGTEMSTHYETGFIGWGTDADGQDVIYKTCTELKNNISDRANAFKDYIDKHPSAKSTEPSLTDTSDGGDSDKTCGDVVTTGIGWIICPVLGTLTAINGTMWAAVENLLVVNPLQQESGGVYDGWKVIRDLANVVFVIAFLVIVFSQLTEAGITNYGVKKMLPRLVVAAILVNISFVIIQVLVDAFNIMGASLYKLIYQATPAIEVGWGSILEAFLGSTSTLATTGIAAIVFAGSGALEAVIWMLFPSAFMGFLSLIAAVLTLIFRQAAIPILAMVAPLAFVAYLLPNTEQWFKKWADLLMRMLMMYPLAALIFGGARFAGATIMGSGDDGWYVIIGLVVMTMPLFSLPFLIKQGGSILNAVGNGLNKLAEKARKPVSDYAGARADHARSVARMQDPKYKMDKDGNYKLDKDGNKIKRNTLDRRMRELGRGHEVKNRKRDLDTKANDDIFMDQAINNKVGATEGRSLSNPKGRPVDFRGSYDRARGASQNLALNDQESDARLHEHNPQFNGQHLKDREFSANARLEKAKANTDERIAEKKEFDGLRLDVDHAKSSAATAQAKASYKVESHESTTQVRAAQNVADTQLKNAQAVTEQAIVEASTSVDSSSLSKAAQTIDSSTRTQLQNNTIEQVVVGSATTAATNQQKQEIADKLVNNTEGVATAAGGIGGAAATARVQATATSEQAAFRRTNVEAATALYTHQKYTTGDSGDLMTVITGGNNKDHTVPTSEQREAAMNIVFATRSKKSQAKIFDHIANMPNGAEKTAMQQAYDKLLNIDKPVSIGGGTRGKLSVGGQSNILENKGATTPFQDQIITTMKGGKLAAETWASMDKDEIEMYADTLGTEPAKDGHLAGLGSSVIDDDTRGVVADKIETALTDSIISASIKPEQKAQLNRILASLGRPEIA